MALPLHRKDNISGRKFTTEHDQIDPAAMSLLPPPSRSPPPSTVNAFVVASLTTVFLILFRILEFYLWFPSLIWLKLAARRRRHREGDECSRTVVIIGGSFAGLASLWTLLSWQRKQLQRDNDWNVRIVLIDQRDYSEYTPGVLRLFCEPANFFNLAQALPCTNESDNFLRIQGTVMSVVDESVEGEKKKVLTYTATDDKRNASTVLRKLEYDYLILATGSTSVISPKAHHQDLLCRYREWKTAHARLKGAKRVLILGGGAVGVELAAEIVDYFRHEKHVTIVDAQCRLVPLFPTAVGKYAEDFLQRNGVELRLGESLKSWNERQCILSDGTILTADIVYVCFGSSPNSNMVVESSPINTEEKKKENDSFFSLTRRRNIAVKDTLQLIVSDSNLDDSSEFCWFACGDVASPPTNDEKQAFQSEMQGKIAARNVIKLLKQTPMNQEVLLRYPQDIAGSDHIPLVFVLSLGRFSGVLGFNQFCFPGPLAAVVKWILEYTKVSHMRGFLFGKLIWMIGDAVTLFLSRTVILPPSSPSLSTTVSSRFPTSPNATPSLSISRQVKNTSQTHQLVQQRKTS